MRNDAAERRFGGISPTREFNGFEIAAGIWFLIATIVAFQGLRSIDGDLPYYFIDLSHHAQSAINADRGFLFEGMLPNLIGLFLSDLSKRPALIYVGLVASGLAALSGSLIVSLRNGSISILSLILIIAFSRFVDTITLWVGKSDLWLMAFLVMSASRSRAFAVSGACLSAFCHPLVAVVSAGGSVVTFAATEGKWRYDVALAALAGAVCDEFMFHHLFPGLAGRSAFVSQHLYGLILNSVQYGPVTLLSAFVFPILAMRQFVGSPVFVNRLAFRLLIVWSVVVLTIACVLTLDHTRTAQLLTIAPLVLLLRKSSTEARPPGWTREHVSVFASLFAARLVIPHFDQYGPVLFEWNLLRHLV